MKIIYSHLKKLLPELPVTAKQLRDDLTMIGHFVSGFESVEGEEVLDLEIRQNRADCLGYYGIAKDLAVFYNIPLVPPAVTDLNFTGKKLPITITSPDVKRIQAVKISGIKVADSPDWLKKFLLLHDINAVNNLVDLTNYAMLIYGIPCHAFDPAKSTDHLVWENNNNKYKEFETLDGTNLTLTPDCLLVTDGVKPLSLGFIGGRNSGIENTTSSTILEMAVYTPSRIRSDSRDLKTITEASIRLDKYLDSHLIPAAFKFLISQVLSLCKGNIDSDLFEKIGVFEEPVPIPFDPAKPALYAGIDIPQEFAVDVLNRLGCLKTEDNRYIAPSIRADISLEEDLIEEVIRFYGYNKIPVNEPISPQKLPDITPKILYLIEELKDELVKLGYDEVRSWPLTQKPLNQKAIFAQNTINSEYPVLRESMIQSLKSQSDQYLRYKLTDTKFFDIGKIFFKEGESFIEKYSLGVYNPDLNELQKDMTALKLSPKTDGNYAEIILDCLPKPDDYLPSDQENRAYELTSQIITLDANVTLETPRAPLELIKEYSAKIDQKIFWSMEIIDVYQNRYTFRVRYFNCDDKTAKKIHLSVFNLT